MSFLGFGRRRGDDDEIPVSSSSHRKEGSSTGVQSAPPEPVVSPTGPPPTQVNFMSTSPALSSPGLTPTPAPMQDNSRNGVGAAAASNLEIPNIHIFNPAESQQHYTEEEEEQQQQYTQEDEDVVQLKPSIDSYGTAEEEAYEGEDEYSYPAGQQFYDGAENTTNNSINIGQQRSYEDEHQDFSSAYTHASGSMESYEPQTVSSQEEEQEGYAYEYEQSPQPMSSQSGEENEYAAYDADPIPEPVETPYQYQHDQHRGTPPRGTTLPQATTPSHVRRSILQSLRSPNNRTEEEKQSEEEKPKTAADAIFTPEFKQVHQKNVRRRLNAQRNRQELERRLAKITNKLANLTMDREAQQSHFIRDNVCLPMEKAVERVALEKEYQTSPRHTGDRHWMALESRLSRIETEMTKDIHVTMPELIGEKIDRLHNELIHDDAPQNHMDTYRSEKREGTLLREFEAHAGRCRRRYHEERAARSGALEVVRQQLLTVAKLENDPERVEEAIVKVKALRAKLDQERAERRMQDENLVHAIKEEETNMKRAFIQATEVDAMMPSEDVRRAIEY